MYRTYGAVHLENRNGNTPARYGQVETLSRCLTDLKEQNITISAFRGDSASYQKEVLELMDTNGIRFYVRMQDFKGIRQTFAAIEDWQTVLINGHKKEVASGTYSFGKDPKKYRVVITCVKKKDNNQLDAFEGQ